MLAQIIERAAKLKADARRERTPQHGKPRDTKAKHATVTKAAAKANASKKLRNLRAAASTCGEKAR